MLRRSQSASARTFARDNFGKGKELEKSMHSDKSRVVKEAYAFRRCSSMVHLTSASIYTKRNITYQYQNKDIRTDHE